MIFKSFKYYFYGFGISYLTLFYTNLHSAVNDFNRVKEFNRNPMPLLTNIHQKSFHMGLAYPYFIWQYASADDTDRQFYRQKWLTYDYDN